MSNEIISSSIRVNITPPIRRVAADASSSIPLDNINSNQQINLSPPPVSIKKVQNTSYDTLKQSIKKTNSEPTTNIRERSTSSSSTSTYSSKSSNNHSLRSFSADPSINQDDDDDDDDASSNDDINHQWNSNQLTSHIPLRQLSKSIDIFIYYYLFYTLTKKILFRESYQIFLMRKKLIV
jgi:hypothetical protein